MNTPNIEDYLTCQVSEDDWFYVMNAKKSWLDLIDVKAFNSAMREYLEKKNEIYCEVNGLCPSCRRPLELVKNFEEVCGSRRLLENYWVCKRC